jgi:hypothetical protein
LLFPILAFIQLNAQDPNSFLVIKNALADRNIYLAKNELNKQMKENPNDPTLSYYQAEIWCKI